MVLNRVLALAVYPIAIANCAEKKLEEFDITPTGLNPIFKFVLKSRKAKYVTMLLNTHSTASLTLLHP